MSDLIKVPEEVVPDRIVTYHREDRECPECESPFLWWDGEYAWCRGQGCNSYFRIVEEGTDAVVIDNQTFHKNAS